VHTVKDEAAQKEDAADNPFSAASSEKGRL
jgi:hypothetical protein